MRLICPNCGATYEVDAGLIPPAGRDVQCSNCGHGWFQHPEGVEPEDEEDALDAAFAADVSATETDDQGESTGDDPARARAAYEDTYEEDYEDDAEESVPPAWETPSEEEDGAVYGDDYDEDYEDEEDQPVAAPNRRELEPEIADILREEAERESAARRAEAATEMQSQPDLGLDEDDTPQDRSAAARDRMAKMRGHTEDEIDDTPGTRSGLLPDVDEINSTLRGQDERETVDTMPEMAPPPAETGMSFRSGFLIVVIIVAMLVAVYAFAPDIADTAPAAEPALRAYVDAVNQVRVAVNGGIESIVVRINGLIGG
ncbi:zinc-ribbon domain-containing protein [Psychromarinibacter sp. S121]|uniref:zinc-ribbon domain-containing protein n=1 Tax=Psychromarinibacter sp. S121 TaxID=3415127 RepID=UPI003C7A6285